jgi:hypothetical protein
VAASERAYKREIRIMLSFAVKEEKFSSTQGFKAPGKRCCLG